MQCSIVCGSTDVFAIPSKKSNGRDDFWYSGKFADIDFDITIAPVDINMRRKQFMTYMTRASLSEREIEVAWLIYRGYTNLQIGEELFISETTVKKHATHIYEKLKISGRIELKELKYI